ncbi:hypothetical protein D9758_007384 [Tetrapyrgos nigripes]|uniref:ATP-dependent DNA helicase II subunit 2 n=1 Tax=Tetrapyrgos nigripes TaxID=182062 RepID=A0A8H5LLM3_9AGAR|nr:hypothetical protein D9758_007384 [Tetrapyrgos nigripes]
MPAERAGYTVHMFVVDVSKSMGEPRTIHLPPDPNGEQSTKTITNLEWALQYVKLKIQGLIYDARKTDKCGVIIFGAEETRNIVNSKHGGYDNVVEYIPIATPNAGTIAKLDKLKPSTVYGDPVDGLIVATETQAQELKSKPTWTRKITLLTDGQNIIELEEWEATAGKLSALKVSLAVIGVDFDSDDPEYEYQEPNKSNVKLQNEKFWHDFVEKVDDAHIGTLGRAMVDVSEPTTKETKSTLSATVLRLGDVDTRADEAIELLVKTAKCTAVARPKSFKKFGVRMKEGTKDQEEVTINADGTRNITYAQLKTRTDYVLNQEGDEDEDEGEDGEKPKSPVKKEEVDADGDVNMEEEEEGEKDRRVTKEDLLRGFRYGTAYVPCPPDGQFPRLPTKKGIDILGFFDAKKFRRELSMGEVYYVWGDDKSPQQQCAISSIVQAMTRKEVMAIARWVNKDDSDAKMGVLTPIQFDNVDCLLWSQMPFADDVRKYNFASLENLVSKKGEVLAEHPYLPTNEQCKAMENFVEAMDLMKAEKDPETGKYELEWFSTQESYSPALHRVKQAMFHCAVVNDLATNPLDPPHPLLLRYFNPPKKVLKRSRDALEDCITKFKVKEVVRQPKRARKQEHVHAANDEDEELLLDRKPSTSITQEASVQQVRNAQEPSKDGDGSETEAESDGEDLLLDKAPPPKKPFNPLPTPGRSVSPRTHSRSQSDLQDSSIDPQRDPGRVIGRTNPLEDFKKTVASTAVYIKAVQDMGDVITEIVVAPFASRRTAELKECLKEMRRTALGEDEIETWNRFLKDLKDKCLNSRPGNKEFWSEVQGMGQKGGLITSSEAKKFGGSSDVSEDVALEFLN